MKENENKMENLTVIFWIEFAMVPETFSNPRVFPFKGMIRLAF